MSTVKELKEEAKSRGIKGYSSMVKSRLEQAIKEDEASRSVGVFAKPPPHPIPTSPLTYRYVLLGRVPIEDCKLVTLTPDLLIGEYSSRKVDDLADRCNLLKLTVAANSVPVYGVFDSVSETALPIEYRIPTGYDPYAPVSMTKAKNERLQGDLEEAESEGEVDEGTDTDERKE